MGKPSRTRIAELETLIERLCREMMQDSKTRTERNELESELRAAHQALNHCQAKEWAQVPTSHMSH